MKKANEKILFGAELESFVLDANGVPVRTLKEETHIVEALMKQGGLDIVQEIDACQVEMNSNPVQFGKEGIGLVSKDFYINQLKVVEHLGNFEDEGLVPPGTGLYRFACPPYQISANDMIPPREGVSMIKSRYYDQVAAEFDEYYNSHQVRDEIIFPGRSSAMVTNALHLTFSNDRMLHDEAMRFAWMLRLPSIMMVPLAANSPNGKNLQSKRSRTFPNFAEIDVPGIYGGSDFKTSVYVDTVNSFLNEGVIYGWPNQMYFPVRPNGFNAGFFNKDSRQLGSGDLNGVNSRVEFRVFDVPDIPGDGSFLRDDQPSRIDVAPMLMMVGGLMFKDAIDNPELYEVPLNQKSINIMRYNYWSAAMGMDQSVRFFGDGSWKRKSIRAVWKEEYIPRIEGQARELGMLEEFELLTAIIEGHSNQAELMVDRRKLYSTDEDGYQRWIKQEMQDQKSNINAIMRN